MDDESVGSSDSENDGDYVPDEEDHSEESMSEDEHTELNYDDDEEDDESMGNRSNQMNEGNNDMGQPTGPAGEGTGNEQSGEEIGMLEEHEEDDHNPMDLEVGPNEDPGVMDQENEGVEQEGQATSINEKEDDLLTEIDTIEDVTTDEDSEEEKAMQDTPRYNLRKHRGRSYKHVYDPEVYMLESEQKNETGDTMLTTVEDGSEDTAQMSMKKGLKVFGAGGYAAVKQEMQQLHDRREGSVA